MIISELRQAFTMLEVIIVVALIGLLAALGSSYYGNFTKSIDLDSTARSIVSDLKAAQAQAMSGADSNADGISDKWGICFRYHASTPSYDIISPAVDCSSTVKSTVYLQSGIIFSIPGAGTAYVIFDKITGSATLTGVSDIHITGNNQTKTITITSAGLISSD